jgi:hypothetical protein
MYHWKAVTTDGRELLEDQLSYEELPADLSLFQILMSIERDGSARVYPILTIHLEPGWRAIYRRRVAMATGKGKRSCILAGWQENVKGRNRQSLFWIFEDTGEIHATGRFYENHNWFYSPQFRQRESP